MLNAQFRPLDKWPGERTPWKTRKSATGSILMNTNSQLLADPEVVERDADRTPRECSILTTAELEVVTLIAQGFRQKEIAARRDCSPKTVNVHALNAYKKLGIQNRRDIWPALLMATITNSSHSLTQQMIALGFEVLPLPPESAAAIDLAAHFQRQQPAGPAAEASSQRKKESEESGR